MLPFPTWTLGMSNCRGVHKKSAAGKPAALFRLYWIID